MYLLTLEVTATTPSTWFEVGHRTTLGTKDPGHKVGDLIKAWGYTAKILEVNLEEKKVWTAEQEARYQENKWKEIDRHHRKGIE